MTLTLLAVSTVRMSLVLAGGLAAAFLLRRRSAAVRHCVLATAVCSALAVPAVAPVLPAWHIAWVTQSGTGAGAMEPPRSADLSSGPSTIGPVVESGERALTSAPAPGRRMALSATEAVVAIWSAGAVSCALLLMLGAVRLRRLGRSAVPIVDGPWRESLDALAESDRRLQRVTLLRSHRPSTLMTWGTFRPRIILPPGAEAWDQARVRIVLDHEIAHIRRADWVWQFAAEALRMLLWFNPLAWAAASRLRLEAERACDDAVLARGSAPSEYAGHLVAVARTLAGHDNWAPAPAMARTPSLERRVNAMLDPHVVRTPLTRLARLCTIAVGLAFTASVASFAAQSPFATLTGTVHDQLGGTVPKVTLTLTHAESGAKHEITSNGMGRYEFVGLPSGTYTLAAYAAGFSPVQRGLQIAAGQTHTEDVTIDVGTLHETLTVHEGPGTSAPLMPRKAGPVPAAGCTSQPNSGGIKPPLKVHDSKPVYPAAMRGSGLDGRVELEATIGIDGTVLTMRTIGATNPDFEEAARQAVGEWRFTTTLLNCVPVEVKMDVLVAFTP